ncbi:MAG: tape measure protein [Pseudomonas sp.]|uniref:tape measure protein n=1 Tax=Pseudomonas sp. TaxID=306 RepID=UPI003BB747A7
MTDVELRLTADLSSATREVSGFRKEYSELVRAVEKPLRQVDALQQTQENAKKAAAEFYAAKTAVEQLKKATASAGQPIQGLNQELARAERVLARTTLEFDRQKARVREQRAELRAAGVDTHNLATEQQRLQAEMAAGLGAGRNDLATQGIRAKAAALAQVTREQRLANVEQARSDLGVNRARSLSAEVNKVRAQYELLRRTGGLTNKELAIAQQAMTRRVKETQQAMRQLAGERSTAGTAGGLGGAVGGIAAGYATFSAVRGIADAADSYNLMNARLKLATGSQQEFNTANSELRRIAAATQSPLESMVTLYGRISRPLKEAGRSQADILKVTEAVAQSFRISGASAEEAQNGVIQFAQALGSGALRGDEFNSVAEQAPRLMQALAAGIKVPVGALKEMAADGLLTAEVVTNALTGQLDVLRSEAQTLPATVGGALTELADTWNEALGSTNVQPLIDSIRELNKVAKDPSTVEGVGLIAGAITRLGAIGLGAVGDFGLMSKQVAVWAAQLTNSITELDRLDNEIAAIEKTLGGWSIGDVLVDMLFSDAELQEKLKALKEARAQIVDNQSGLNDDLRLLSEIAAGVADASRQAEIDAQTNYLGELKALQGQQLADAKKAIKEQESLQKKAQTAKDKIGADRKAIDAKYDETKVALSGVGGGTASYAGAQALKVNARASVQAGDSARAITQAEAARKALLDIQAAGGNTYGFAGFADELRAIEQAAKDIEDTEADRKLLVIASNIAVLKAQADELKNITVTPVMDDAATAGLVSRLQALATSLGNTLTIPVKMVAAGFAGDMNSLALQPTDQVSYPGLSTGGWTGPGDKFKPAGIVHADEHVQPKRVVNEPGALSFLEQIRRNGYRNTMNAMQSRMAAGVRGYAEGGLVSVSKIMPSIPAMNPSLSAGFSPAPGRDLGRVLLNIGGETHSLLADADSFERILQLESIKFGRTKKR